jgi:DNA-binding GntR family transcriptional regulator
LKRIRELLFIHSERYRVLSIHTDRPHLDSEHRDIAEADIARDTERAVALLADHVKLTARIILQNEADGSESPFLAAAPIPKPIASMS